MKRLLTHLSIAIWLAAGCGPQALRSATSAVGAPEALAFGDARVGEHKRLTLTLTSQALTSVDLISAQVAAPFSVSAVAVTIPSGGSATIDVVFAPEAGKAYAQDLSLQLTAADTSSLTVHLSGTGVLATPGGTPDAGPTSCSAATCGGTSACCGDACVDTQSDPAHCGGCSACAAGQTCSAGTCQTPPASACDDLTSPCPGAQKCCAHACVDVGASGLCPCSGPTSATVFGAGSIIIPMDACYQRGVDVATLPSYCNAANAKAADDSPLKAYGLVFFLLRHQVTVYMAIDPAKTTIDAVDLQISSYLTRKAAVDRYDWSTGKVGPLPDPNTSVVTYRGAPFLIDSSQHDRVLQLLATHADFAQFRTAGNVAVHVANKDFSTTVAKSIKAVPSRVALLQVPASRRGDSPTDILVRYLTSAGLNFDGAGGTPAAPGQIYDVLQEADFLPDYDRSKLKAGGYKLLWSPHWEGGTSNTPAQLSSIGAFVNAGNDLFAECAAIGTLEGFISSDLFGYYQPGSSATRFMTSYGLTGNLLPVPDRGYDGPFVFSGLTSPFAQRGDFPFLGAVGLVTDFAAATGTYRSGVQHYITATKTGSDLFSSIDQHGSGKGTVVYLSGHDYSYGGPNAGNIGLTAGSRLVLNTLFSLGANNTCQ